MSACALEVTVCGVLTASPSLPFSSSSKRSAVFLPIPGTSNGAAYFAALENTGNAGDRLLRATTPAASRVELHTMAVDAQGVMRMREVDGIALAPHAKIEMRPGSGMHLMLIGLKEPLKEGSSFPMTLQFERAGVVEVKVVVQATKPRDGASAPHSH